MFKWNLFSPRCYWFGLGLVFVTAFALAQAPAPSQEFWEYVEEYGDANGNVLDPLEYDQITHVKNDEKQALPVSPNQETPNDKATDKVKVRNADMKFEQSSSAVSSSTMKGAKL